MSIIRKTAVILLLIAGLFILTVPASADLSAEFDYQVYKIHPADFPDNVDYSKYRTSSTIYEVDFEDRSSGGPTSWYWDFGDIAWATSDKEDPVMIFTEDEVSKVNYKTKVMLRVMSNGIDDTASHYVYFQDDPWALSSIIVVTPTPTPTPTPVPATAAPTPVPTPTPEPTPAADISLNVPVAGNELTKLQTVFTDYINLIKAILGKK